MLHAHHPYIAASALVVVLALAAARPASAQPFASVTFPELTAHVAFSTGVTWVDADQDGDLDLYVVTGFSANNENVFYRNDGGTFARVTGVPIVEDFADTPCSTWADWDNDGDVDCFITNTGTAGGMLFDGAGGGALTLDASAGLTLPSLKGTGCAWGDYDNDGNLDLIVAAISGQLGMTLNRLFRGNGDGTFTEVTGGPETTTTGSHHHVTWSDYDGDGDLDLFFASGGVGSARVDHMFRNRRIETGTATFEAITTGTFATESRDSQVLSWVDYDDDGDLDLYAVNYALFANQLYRNDGGGTFTKLVMSGISSDVGAAHGVVWGDFDNDGDQDCYVVRDLGQSNRYYRNNGNGTFTTVTGGAFVAEARSNYGAAAGDYDLDGDLDLFVPTARSEGPSLLFRNDVANGNHWLIVRLAGTTSNRSGIGARVRVKAATGGTPRWQMREVLAGTSYGGHNALEAHFGLGAAPVADSVRIEWPSGLVDVKTSVAANARLVVTEGETIVGVGPDDRARGVSLAIAPNPITDRARVEFRLPRASAIALELFDAAGRRLSVLERGTLAAGVHRRAIEARALPGPGVYLVRLSAGDQRVVRRFVRVE